MTLAPQDIDVQDIDVMARPIQGEARGEPWEGKIAFPKTVGGFRTRTCSNSKG